ncbi:MAG: formylglycine-generating enzyme family protein [Kiritimatiellae bacterium]|nr:formylglycine-generating enzyme family protein [Kiritimatiellia bacterium]
MKTMMKWILGSFAACFALGAAAGPEISGVVVRQRWPWSRLVDIDYVLTCDDTQCVDVAISAYNDASALTLPGASFSGDIYAVSNGARRIVWDPTVTSCTNAGVLGKFRVTLTPSIVSLYMAVDLSGGPSAAFYPVTNYLTEADVSGGITNDLYKTTHLLLRRIPANTFNMGVNVDCPVTLTKPFYAGVYEVTQRQWELVKGDRPSKFTADYEARPVEQVTYNLIRGAAPTVNWPKTGHAVAPDSFLGKLQDKTGLAEIDLPTDAQSECLCRAGRQTYYNDGIAGTPNTTSNAQLNVLGRYKYNGGMLADGSLPAPECGTTNGTAVVGSYRANDWGLYDTHGNVHEWCLNLWTNSLGTASVTDPAGPVANSNGNRMFRGGSMNNQASDCRSAYRYEIAPTFVGYNLGFRLVRTLP